jgi:sigma-B regulation protein RsbU (phosphoserine phosphatase)
MKTSIKLKLSILISALVVVILGINAAFLITQKIQEGKTELESSARSFTNLSHKVVGDAYIFYGESGFIKLKNIVQKQMDAHPDIRGIQILGYNGEVKFDNTDKSPRKETKKPQMAPESLLKSIQGRDSSFIKTSDLLEVVSPYYDDFNNHSVTIKYEFTYDRIRAAVEKTITIIAIISLVAIAISIITGLFFAVGITNPLKKVMQGARSIAKGEYSTRIDLKSHDETKELADTFNQMAVDLYNNTQELIEKERLEEEMKLAGKIQQDSLPKEIPTINGLDIAVSVTPAEAVGGDIYDFISDDPNKLTCYLGDATGHGVPAGLLVAITTAIVYNDSSQDKSSLDMVNNLNKILYKKTSMDMFLTMAMMSWDAKSKTIKCTMAGHEQILSYVPKAKEIDLVPPGGMAVGMMPDVSAMLKEQDIKMKTGQVLAIYSDGIPEAWDKDRENIFGFDKFKEVFKKHCENETDLQKIHDNIIKDVYDFMGGSPQEDDVTLMLLRAK